MTSVVIKIKLADTVNMTSVVIKIKLADTVNMTSVVIKIKLADAVNMTSVVIKIKLADTVNMTRFVFYNVLLLVLFYTLVDSNREYISRLSHININPQKVTLNTRIFSEHLTIANLFAVAIYTKPPECVDIIRRTS